MRHDARKTGKSALLTGLLAGLALLFCCPLVRAQQMQMEPYPPVQVDMEALPPLTLPPLTAPHPAPPLETPQDGPVFFPVTLKERSDQFDPGLPKSPVQTEVNRQRESQKSAALNPPLPPLKPLPAAASRRRAAVIPSMPAVPAGRIEAEPLNKAKNAAITAKPIEALSEADKDALVRIIERIAAKAEAAKTVLTASPERSTQHIAVFSVPLPPRKPGSATPQSPAPLPTAMAQRFPPPPPPSAIEPAAGAAQALLDITEPFSAASLEDQKGNKNSHISVAFAPGQIVLDESTVPALARKILPDLRNNPGRRVQIRSFASDSGEALPSSRRTALSRALAVRSYLVDHGVEARRMDVRALGAQTEKTPVDRVDFIFLDPRTME